MPIGDPKVSASLLQDVTGKVGHKDAAYTIRTLNHADKTVIIAFNNERVRQS